MIVLTLHVFTNFARFPCSLLPYLSRALDDAFDSTDRNPALLFVMYYTWKVWKLIDCGVAAD